MRSLADLQCSFARALLEGPEALPVQLFAAGAIAPSDALRVYRNTVLGGLAEALALAFPTVRRLVGEVFFDQAANAYALADPPSQASLMAYGQAFPGFLETYAPAAELHYLADVARLDLAIEQATLAPRGGRLLPIEDAVRLSVPLSLAVMELEWPADQIRDAVETGDADALAAVDLHRAPRGFAVWRSGEGAALKPLGASATRFLGHLLLGGEAEDALTLAASGVGRDAALLAIQADVFAASFAQVVIMQTRSFQPCLS
jgi:hypothetical protein